MTKIILYIASSLDGYIARKDGSVDWLDSLDNPENSDFGYGEFMANIDILIMGRKTYEVVVGFDMPWPYKNIKTYVVTQNRDLTIDSPDTHLLHDIDKKAIEEIRRESARNVWLVGGGSLVTTFLNYHAVDEIILSQVPIILGEGIRLFPGKSIEVPFQLTKHEVFPNGLVQLNYLQRPISV